jgi:hypothetical protein
MAAEAPGVWDGWWLGDWRGSRGPTSRVRALA